MSDGRASDAVVKVDINLVSIGGVVDQVIGHCTSNARSELTVTPPSADMIPSVCGSTNADGDFVCTDMKVSQRSGWAAVLRCFTPAGDLLKLGTTCP